MNTQNIAEQRIDVKKTAYLVLKTTQYAKRGIKGEYLSRLVAEASRMYDTKMGGYIHG